jgi:hypothetical protein
MRTTRDGESRWTRWGGRFVLCLGSILSMGCGFRTSFPTPLATRVEQGETVVAFDMNHDGRPDFWEYQPADGRIRALAYATPGTDEPGPRIELDDIPVNECPHLLIGLDGVPFEVVDDVWRQGHLRLFRPPTRVVCCFPSMTDLAYADLFHDGPCLGYQALYFDHQANRRSNGDAVYLKGGNSPWLADVDYRCSLWWDALVYLSPQAVFHHELAGMRRAFQTVADGEAWAYSVGTAALGTRGGRPAMERYLQEIDAFCQQIVYERKGRVRITLTADHGHDLVANRLVSFDGVLKAGGYHSARALHGPRDVVTVAYGLVTYADFATQDPAGVAQCLLQHEDVEFACYPAGNALVVRSRTGEARITKGSSGFVYEPTGEDPLRLAPIIEQLRRAGQVSPAGEIVGDALFQATLDHYYPDPLARLWAAFHELVDNPPDLIVNLRDGACHGAKFFYAMIGKPASTHGALNRRNSTTFVLTTLGALPPALRTREVLPALERLGCRK